MNRLGENNTRAWAASFLLIGFLAVGYFAWNMPFVQKLTGSGTEQAEETIVPVVAQDMLIPGGQSVGVRMDVKGVLIVGLEDIKTVDGTTVNPGMLAGLQIGDSVLSIDGVEVNNAREVQQVINQVQDVVSIRIMRKGQAQTITMKPVVAAKDNLYKLGIWVRDKTAGLGTLTFYNPSNNTYGALGHAITDPATGSVLAVADGQLIYSKVESVKQGKAGEPGEIHGIFYEADEPFGVLLKNTDFGIYGTLYDSVDYKKMKPMPIGYQNQVKRGKAYILTTIDGKKVEKFEISIEKINAQASPDTKSMVIRVTDQRLLDKTGGIVQGMSGSPILQDDKIIGAITHVFVNDPQRGYGIFIEWMLSESKELE